MSAVSAPARKTVTILFSDVVDFTGFSGRHDPETVQEVMGRYFAPMETVIHRHGGVMKFIGDGIIAMFGVPTLHEDDPLRAARCALEMRDALGALNLEFESGWGVTFRVRYGIATGEVAFARVRDDPHFPLGDAVNRAKRLETAAPEDEVLVCPATARALGRAARLEPFGPLALKGIPEPVFASRLQSLRPFGETTRGPPAARIVGRDDELGILRAALEDVTARRRCRVVTVVGEAGVGKSSLVSRFVSDLEGSITAVTGHCLSYGEHITFWPLAEIVEQLTASIDKDAIAALVGDDEDGRWVADRVASAVGSAPSAIRVEEIQLAVRRLLEAAARRQPVVVVVEDIHWAERTLLDVLDHVALQAQGVALLLVCLARPVTDRRPAALFADCIELRRLSEADSADLLDRLDQAAALDAGERGRVLAAADGNPLFLEQMVAMTHEGGSAGAMPENVQALLSARVDGLPDGERAVITCAAVEGREFHRGAVAGLLATPRGENLDEALASLVRRDLIRPGQAKLPGDTGYRFSHSLVGEAAYLLLSKTRRAELHERFARWLAYRGSGERELREMIGLHFEKAYQCSTELRPKGAHERQLGREGSHHLGGVGRAALVLGDLEAAKDLLARALAMLDDDEPSRGRLLPELGVALAEAGEFAKAEGLLADAVRRASLRGERVQEAHARLALLAVWMQVDTGAAVSEVLRRFSDLEATFTAHVDERGLDGLWHLRAKVHWLAARSRDADDAWLMAVEHAERAGDARGRADALSWLASSAFMGPTPAADAIKRCEEIRDELRGNRREEASVLQPLAALRAMRGEFALARELLEESGTMLTELGVGMDAAVQDHYEAFVALLAGDAALAERRLRHGYEDLHDMGEKAFHADTAVLLARALQAQRRHDEALELIAMAKAEADEYDLSPQFSWRAVGAVILAARGELDDALRLSHEAVALVERTDWLSDHADVLIAHADVLTAHGDHAEAERTVRAALDLYDRKGNVVAAERARNRSHLDART